MHTVLLAIVLKYTVIMAGHPAGAQTTSIDGATRTVDFEFNDRGRGPKTHTVMSPGSMTTTGVDYYKASVDETFANGKWSNGAENGSSTDAKALYASMYGPPEESAAFVRTLLAMPGHKAPLLPAGEASIKKLGDLTVDGKKITAYDIYGFGFSPATVWLDDKNELFATASSWLSVIAEGHDAAIPQLVKAQDEWHAKVTRSMSAKLTHKPKGGGIVITNARLFDPATGKLTPNAMIVIRGNKVESISGPDVPSFEHIDAGNRVVIPGLWDMHTHNGDDDGMLNIANGVTSVRDLGNDIDTILNLKKEWESGEAVGPRVVLAGLVDGPGPYAGPTKMLVSNEDEARAAIDKYASLGFEQLKIYSSVKPELVPFMAKHAHEKGMRVSGHIPAGMIATDAVKEGYDEIQHINMLMLNFMPDVKETQTRLRLTAPAERGGSIDLNSPEVKAFVDLLKEHHTVIDPTLGVFEGSYIARKGTMSPTFAAAADRLPPQVRRGFLTGGLPVPVGKDQTYRDSFANMERMVKLLYDNGIPIVAGTDGLAGFALDRELELYVQLGIPAPEVLRIATLGAATVMHRADRLGSIAPGKLADLDIVDGDPTTNISDVRNVRTVIKDGNVFDAKEVAAAIGVH
ncbi:MAG TPA: amidohydrolase family protein [Thermoanaerobaculia bacterium]|nr:amidohydrolase family protein [Thermoanaerobaculia bacterium]